MTLMELILAFGLSLVVLLLIVIVILLVSAVEVLQSVLRRLPV